jgi:lysophospholipase L1-like esterase
MAYLDLTTALGGARITSGWIDNERMQTDGMHFTAGGYQTIASILFEAWIDAYSNAQKAPLLNRATEVKQAQ